MAEHAVLLLGKQSALEVHGHLGGAVVEPVLHVVEAILFLVVVQELLVHLHLLEGLTKGEVRVEGDAELDRVLAFALAEGSRAHAAHRENDGEQRQARKADGSQTVV